MKRLSKLIVNCSVLAVMPLASHAAGTYYNGAYQSPQQRYAQPGYARQTGYNGYAQPQQNNGYMNQNAQYSRQQQSVQQQTTVQRQTRQGQAQQQSAPQSPKDEGFYLTGGISRETATWQFDMAQAGSSLMYRDISWNVFDVNGGYKFSAGNTPMVISAGIKIGMQSGETPMIDDDISKGGQVLNSFTEDGTGKWLGDQIGHALSIGSSSGGSMLGYNVALGLTDFFAWGKTKITPSIGYRSFSYKLETSKNAGMAIDTLSTACLSFNGEEQCDPLLLAYYFDSGTRKDVILTRDNDLLVYPGEYIDTLGTYYYNQPGVSHSYEVAWAGPFVALDANYEINQYNAVSARIELGLPGYSAIGDQPYRFDWQHPKSVEDSAGMGSALHFGMGADWRTAVSDTVMLSVGLTYDYYSVSGASAKTYLNGDYYMGIFNNLLNGGIINGQDWGAGYPSAADMIANNSTAANINQLSIECPGWVCTMDNEIESFYKSLGIRIGLNARF